MHQRRQVLNKIPTQGRRHGAKGVFQINPSVSGLNLRNNITVLQVRVNIRLIKHDTIFEIP